VKWLEKTTIERGRRREHPNQHFCTTKKKARGKNDVTSCEKATYCVTSDCAHLENMEERQVE